MRLALGGIDYYTLTSLPKTTPLIPQIGRQRFKIGNEQGSLQFGSRLAPMFWDLAQVNWVKNRVHTIEEAIEFNTRKREYGGIIQ